MGSSWQTRSGKLHDSPTSDSLSLFVPKSLLISCMFLFRPRTARSAGLSRISRSQLITPAIRAPFTQSAQPRRAHDEDIMGKKDGGGKTNYTLKVPKGTKDWDGSDMVIREKIFSTITNVFKRHGAVTIDT